MQKSNKKIMVVPNLAIFVREVSEYGNTGAVLRRVLALPLALIFKLAWINKGKIVKLAKKDFVSGLILLLQIELLKTGRRQEYAALADQVVDLAVALKNKQLLEGLVGTVRSFGYKPVLVTNNLSYLFKFLSDTKIRDVWLSYPHDPQRYGKLLEPQRIIPYELVA